MTAGVGSSPISDMCTYLIKTAETDLGGGLNASVKILGNSAGSCGVY